MNQKESVQKWLSQDALPLWIERGIAADGSFIENLSREGDPIPGPQRAMVQGRQMYALSEAVRMNLTPKAQIAPLVHRAADTFIKKYSLPSGAVVHAVEPDGTKNPQLDLYAQAFALFGLAHAFDLTGEAQFKARALKLLSYLYSERRLLGGVGFSEYIGGEVAFEANPHMHLFEAALAWMKFDGENSDWRSLADEISGLCVGRFVDQKTGALCEHFDSQWKPLLENGNFVFEPGHHYEWAWLLISYQELTSASAGSIPLLIFDVAEKAGVDAKSGLAYDEVWSNGVVKKRSSRFWPQTERMKAAVSLAVEADSKQAKDEFYKAADQATEALFKFLRPVKPGLWEDTLQENGNFTNQVVKASSLYHIICAMSEYIRKR